MNEQESYTKISDNNSVGWPQLYTESYCTELLGLVFMKFALYKAD